MLSGTRRSLQDLLYKQPLRLKLHMLPCIASEVDKVERDAMFLIEAINSKCNPDALQILGQLQALVRFSASDF
jgi:hypothetical protein